MNARTCGKIAALAAPLLLAVLFGCVEPLDTIGFTSGTDPYVPPPAGKRYLVINVGETIARTIVPISPTITKYEALAIGAGATTILSKDFGNSASGTMTLDSTEVYQIIVNAFAAGTTLVASANATGINNSFTSIDLTLQAQATAHGTFNYDFGAASSIGADSVILDFNAVSAGASHASIDLSTTKNGSAQLSSGVYRVSLIMQKARHITTYNEQYIYIRDNLVTEWIPITLPNPAKNNFDVNYNLNAGGENATWNPSAGSQSLMINIGSELSKPNPSPTITGGKTFGNWYTSATATTGRLWIFTGDTIPVGTSVQNKVISDITLYANWVEAYFYPVITINPMNLSVTDPGITVAVATFSQTFLWDNPDVTTNDKVTFNITGGGSGYSGLTWRYNGLTINDSMPGVVLSDNNSSLELDMYIIYTTTSHPLTNLLAPGESHTIFLSGINPAPSSQFFAVNVQLAVTTNP